MESLLKALRHRNFDAHLVPDPDAARELVLDRLVPEERPLIASWGDSMTLAATGIVEAVATLPGVELIRTFEPGVAREEILERRRQALLSDLFFLGTNAITADGVLVNLDMVGNRVAGLVYGPRKVVVVVGTSKVVPDLDAALDRVKTIAAPKNAARHDLKTPCVATGECHDCASPQRICNVWTLTERSWPKHRISVVLIDEKPGEVLGL
jgi:hypothetical protein